MIPFSEYYRKYLGIDSYQIESDRFVFPSERRAKSVAHFYVHHLISTVIDGRLIHSISPRFAADFTSLIGQSQVKMVNLTLCRDIDDSFFYLLPPLSYSSRIMRRMTMDCVDVSQSNEKIDVCTISESDKKLFDKQLLQRGKKFAEFIWNERLKTINSGRYFAVIEDDKIVSSSFVSDIDNQAGNIVVSTKPEYRKRGYGKAVVLRAAEWCIQNGIRPIYLVDEDNTPSVRLAEGLGFTEQAREVIVSTYKKFAFNPYEASSCQG
ncbi:hypothetical protein CSA37_00285 [Candidatus Fermentibacteria bacterium]|nr:MAG: hypothetical protein CSA37_00285 [Candidatus Fermentibacteria bacterium]